jgi:hypothetical protein
VPQPPQQVWPSLSSVTMSLLWHEGQLTIKYEKTKTQKVKNTKTHHNFIIIHSVASIMENFYSVHARSLSNVTKAPCLFVDALG